MKNQYSAATSIDITADKHEVWDALVNPDKIKQYLHGTHAASDWKEGSTLEFTGEWKGKSYKDKGIILNKEEDQRLQYSWLSSNSGLEDKEENYATVTYDLMEKQGSTILTVTQDNIGTEAARDQSVENWSSVLEELKKVVEKG